MKTLTYISTLLAVTIQIMVIAQNSNKQIRVDIMGNKPTKTVAVLNNNSQSGELMKNISENSFNIKEREHQSLKLNEEKLINGISESRKKALILDIKIAQEQSNNNFKTYVGKKSLFSDLFFKIEIKTTLTEKAYTINGDAERLMNSALKMIDESNKELNDFIKYGELTNANEKEFAAIKKQTEAIDLLKQILTTNDNKTNIEKITKFTEINSDKREVNSNEKKLMSLISITENLSLTITNIKKEFKSKTNTEKQLMLEEIKDLEKDYYKNMITVSEIESQIICQAYNQNKNAIVILLNDLTINSQNYKKVIQLISEAERSFKIGKEIREEAMSQININAIYGEMTNAKEIEKLAIQKQMQAKMLLVKTNSMSIASQN